MYSLLSVCNANETRLLYIRVGNRTNVSQLVGKLERKNKKKKQSSDAENTEGCNET